MPPLGRKLRIEMPPVPEITQEQREAEDEKSTELFTLIYEAITPIESYIRNGFFKRLITLDDDIRSAEAVYPLEGEPDSHMMKAWIGYELGAPDLCTQAYVEVNDVVVRQEKVRLRATAKAGRLTVFEFSKYNPHEDRMAVYDDIEETLGLIKRANALEAAG